MQLLGYLQAVRFHMPGKQGGRAYFDVPAIPFHLVTSGPLAINPASTDRPHV